MDKEIIYTVAEVSKMLKINKNLIYKLIDKGYLKAMKIGCIKITNKSLVEFLEKYDGYDFSNIDNLVRIVNSKSA